MVLACVWSYVPQVNSLTEWKAFLVYLWNDAPQVNSLTEWRTFLESLLSDVPKVQFLDRGEDAPGEFTVCSATGSIP